MEENKVTQPTNVVNIVLTHLSLENLSAFLNILYKNKIIIIKSVFCLFDNNNRQTYGIV